MKVNTNNSQKDCKQALDGRKVHSMPSSASKTDKVSFNTSQKELENSMPQDGAVLEEQDNEKHIPQNIIEVQDVSLADLRKQLNKQNKKAHLEKVVVDRKELKNNSDDCSLENKENSVNDLLDKGTAVLDEQESMDDALEDKKDLVDKPNPDDIVYTPDTTVLGFEAFADANVLDLNENEEESNKTLDRKSIVNKEVGKKNVIDPDEIKNHVDTDISKDKNKSSNNEKITEKKVSSVPKSAANKSLKNKQDSKYKSTKKNSKGLTIIDRSTISKNPKKEKKNKALVDDEVKNKTLSNNKKLRTSGKSELIVVDRTDLARGYSNKTDTSNKPNTSDKDTTLISQIDSVDEKKPSQANNKSKKNIYKLVRISTKEEVTITGDRFIVGKSKHSTYQVKGNNTVSRSHALFTVENNCLYITDMASKNGTFVDGQNLKSKQKKKLKDGSVIRMSDEAFEINVISR